MTSQDGLRGWEWLSFHSSSLFSAQSLTQQTDAYFTTTTSRFLPNPNDWPLKPRMTSESVLTFNCRTVGSFSMSVVGFLDSGTLDRSGLHWDPLIVNVHCRLSSARTPSLTTSHITTLRLCCAAFLLFLGVDLLCSLEILKATTQFKRRRFSSFAHYDAGEEA